MLAPEYESAARDATRLGRFLAVLADPGPLARVADRAVLALSELFAADVVVLLLPAPLGALAPLAAIGLPEEEGPAVFSAAAGRHAVEAMQARAPVLVPAARGDPGLDPRLAALEVEAAVWVPVTGSGAVLGALGVARCRQVPFSRADADLLLAMAYRVGLLVERARAEAERRDLEVRLRQAEKADSLERMAAAIAHHFNNMLGAVLASLELAESALPGEHPVQGELAAARAAAREASRVSSLMLTYLGQGGAARECLDLSAACREALAALVPGAGVRVVADLPLEPVLVRVHGESVRQVLGNLVTNAFEALPPAGGVVRVALREVPGGEVVGSPYAAPGFVPEAARYACLEVSDTGSGVEPGALGRVFDPFYSTKFAGRGLGLPVVLGVARAHGGTVAVESAPGRGSAFRVYLPVADLATAPRPVETPRPAAIPARRGLALVVDDEPLLLRAASRLVARLGWEVVTAGDGEEALERFRARPGEVRFVLLDVTMPRMGGWEALAALRALAPGLPVILASGYDEARVMAGDHPERPQAFLHKPFEGAEIQAAIERVLGGK